MNKETINYETDNPVFRPRKLEITAHEFCHSFTNPVVDKYMKQLQPAGEKLYTAIYRIRAGAP